MMAVDIFHTLLGEQNCGEFFRPAKVDARENATAGIRRRPQRRDSRVGRGTPRDQNQARGAHPQGPRGEPFFVNFFEPSFKLPEKTRSGAQVTKQYHAQKTAVVSTGPDPLGATAGITMGVA